MLVQVLKLWIKPLKRKSRWPMTRNDTDMKKTVAITSMDATMLIAFKAANKRISKSNVEKITGTTTATTTTVAGVRTASATNIHLAHLAIMYGTIPY